MKTISNACVLIEAGFELVCDFNGNKLFKKRKITRVPGISAIDVVVD